MPLRLSDPLGAALVVAVLLTVWLITSGSGVTDPRSGIARPAGFGPVVPYGNDVPLWTVVLASGSFCERKDSQTLVPWATPYFACASSRARAELTSLPPPVPKMPATTAAVATTSVTFQGWVGHCRPSATYSPGYAMPTVLM